MARLGDHLGCKVFWSTAIGHARPILVEEVGPAEVSYFHGALCVEQYVLGFDVSVYDWRVHRVQILDRGNNLAKILSGDTFGESSFPLEDRVDLAFWCKLQDEVEGIIILVVVVQLDDVLVVQFVHDLDFELDLLHQVMLDDLRLVDDLDGIHILGALMSDFVHLAEAANADV